jgi:hypothetical protein
VANIKLHERPLTEIQRKALVMLCMASYFDQFVSLYEIADHIEHCTKSVGVALRYLRKRGLVAMTERKERPAGSRQKLNVRYFKATSQALVAIGETQS